MLAYGGEVDSNKGAALELLEVKVHVGVGLQDDQFADGAARPRMLKLSASAWTVLLMTRPLPLEVFIV